MKKTADLDEAKLKDQIRALQKLQHEARKKGKRAERSLALKRPPEQPGGAPSSSPSSNLPPAKKHKGDGGGEGKTTNNGRGRGRGKGRGQRKDHRGHGSNGRGRGRGGRFDDRGGGAGGLHLHINLGNYRM